VKVTAAVLPADGVANVNDKQGGRLALDENCHGGWMEMPGTIHNFRLENECSLGLGGGGELLHQITVSVASIVLGRFPGGRV
jgi:hypothetical protein